MQSRILLKDVAARSGVSLNTVSCVLNDKPEARISPEMQERVRQAAQALGYQPNALARSLRGKSTNIIGMFSGYGHIGFGWFQALCIQGALEGCSLNKMDLLLHSTFRGPSTEDIYRQLADGKIDGLVVLASMADELIQRLVEAPFPVVAIADAVPALSSVVVDDVAGARMMAKHLASKGHKRILYRKYLHAHTSIVRRYKAFVDEAYRLGMQIVETYPRDTGGALSAEEIDILRLPAEDRPTAVAACMDLFAHRFVDYCNDHTKLRVPEDIAVIGFDGIKPEIRPAYHLTTIRAPWVAVGSAAVSVIAAKLAGETVPHETVVPVEFVAGTTT